MQAKFNIDRERHNKLFYKEYTNDECVFQFHSQIELYFVEDGEMEFFVNNHRRVLKKGEMSVALSYDTHAYKTPEYSRSSVLIIPTYMCENFIVATKHKRASNPFICDAKTVEKIKECISELKSDGINELRQQGYIYVILGIIMENIFFENSDTSLDTQLSSRILFYINENFKNDISLTSITEEFGYNRSYVSRYFKSCFNIGINQYLTSIRLKNALMLMNERRHSFTHCALESGFNSMRTFYRVFEKEFNCSPKEYMQRIKEA